MIYHVLQMKDERDDENERDTIISGRSLPTASQTFAGTDLICACICHDKTQQNNKKKRKQLYHRRSE